jgi:ketosteroid isomerase-like protein
VGASTEASCHFTYHPLDGGDLQQGDLLTKSGELLELLREVHPHYHHKGDYTHLFVLTQSCDLVRRDGKPCKARYVSVAAVRPFSLVIEREIAKYQDTFDGTAGVCAKTKRALVEQFVERILNNNEPEYFYLEPEPAFGLHEPSCAFLRLSIAVRAHQHYQKLLAARVLSLTDVFQAKLGWLVGNMYSRVGTADWVPDSLSDEGFRAKVRGSLDADVQWIEADQLRAAKKAPPAGLATRDAMREHIKATKAPKKKEQLLDAVIRVVQAQALVADDEAAKKLRQRLENDPDFSGLSK